MIILSTLLLGTTVLWADKFWEKKGFTEWTEKEAIRMMHRSPWAHRVKFRLQNLKFLERDLGNSDRERLLPDPDGKRNNPRSNETGYLPYEHERGPNDEDGTAKPPSRYSPQTRPGPRQLPVDFGNDTFVLPLTVRWYVLPVQHAIDRWAALRPGVKQGWNVHGDGFYIIGISGLPARMFPGDPDRLKWVRERLKSKSFLKIKGREPISADAVVIPRKRSDVVDVRAGPWRAGVEIYVVFLREQKDRHEITLADKKVEFVTKIGSLKVKRKFKLKDMVYKGKLEL